MASQQRVEKRSIRPSLSQMAVVLSIFILTLCLTLKYPFHQQAAPSAARVVCRPAQPSKTVDGELRRGVPRTDSSLAEGQQQPPGLQPTVSARCMGTPSGTPTQDPTEAMCERHKRCVFVASTGRAGSTNLQDALNQIPGVFVRGENYGLFKVVQQMSGVVDKVMKVVEADFALEGLRKRVATDAKEEYEQYISARLKTAWVNSWPRGSPQCAASMIFKRLYGAGKFWDYIVGFKEVRYSRRSGLKSYDDLQRHLDFVRSLCEDSRIVLNMRHDVKATAHSGHFKGANSKQWEGLLAQEVAWLKRYAAARPDSTLVMYHEDMFDATKNQTLAEDLMKFIGVEKTEISFGRLKRWWPYPRKRGGW